MFYVVVYDLPDNRRRTRLAKLLLSFGARVQESVFECDLQDADELARMVKKIERQIIPEEGDAVRIYRLCANCTAETRIMGAGELTRDVDLIII